MTIDRGITIRQPWASLIGLGVKTWDTRSRPTSYRGPVMIHAAAKRPRTEWFRDGGKPMPPWFDLVAMESCYRIWEDERDGWWTLGGYEWVGPLGAVVAVADIVDSLPITEGLPVADRLIDFMPATRQLLQWEGRHDTNITDQLPYSDWSPGRWAHQLANVRQLDEPVPCKGSQAYPWRADQATIDAVNSQLGGA